MVRFGETIFVSLSVCNEISLSNAADDDPEISTFFSFQKLELIKT